MMKVTSLLGALLLFALTVAAQTNNGSTTPAVKAAAPVPTKSSSPKTEPSNAKTSETDPPAASPSPAVTAPSPAVTTPSPAATNSNGTNTSAPTTAALTGKGAVVIPPEKANPITVPRFDKPPVIDGKLDDPVWQNAVVLKDFYQIDPGDNVAPSKPTEVLLGYDSKTLYIAFKAYDEPDKIRATVAKRDNIFQDDYVGFFLDTFNDKRKAFEMFFNPLGIQGDGILTEGSGEDFSVDVLMESKGTVNELGFFVEIAIPFKSIRYEAGKGKLWGAHFFRRIKRFENELDSWMPFSRSVSSNLSQAGHLTGLEGIAGERTLEIIPSLTLSQDGKFVRSFGVFPNTPAAATDPGRIVNQPIHFDPGLTAKFIPSPAITLDLAINPDFAQVEADQIVVTANQRFPIFFPEKRPFFLEGIEIFRTPVTTVHTRAIVDPDLAVKTTGKIGRNSFGLMLASDNGPGTFVGDERLSSNNFRFLDKNAYVGVLRLKRDVGKENSIGLLATTYNFVEKHNQLVSVDGRFRFDKSTTFNFQVIGTNSRNFFFNPHDPCGYNDPPLPQCRPAGLYTVNEGTRYRNANGFGYSTAYVMSGRNWGYEFGGEGFTSDYRADVGFFQRTNSNFTYGIVRYNSDPNKKKKIISYHVHNFTHIDYDWQGRMYAWEAENLVELVLPRSSWVGVWWEPGYERLFDHEFGPTRQARPCNPFAVRDAGGCTFFGQNTERSSAKQHISGYFGSNLSKKFQFNGQVIYRVGHMDLDFGNGSRYPRVSPAAMLLGEDAPLDPGRGGLLQVNGAFYYTVTDAFKTSISLNKQRLRRYDTGLVAFDVNIINWRGTYQFSKATFARIIMDYNTLNRRVRAQFLAGWTPSPGTSFYVGYNDDMTYENLHPFTREIVPGFRRNSRTFFIKMSYLLRKSFGS